MMRFSGWILLGLLVIVCVAVELCEAFPKGCHYCATREADGFPREKCCNECPVCRYNFDVEAPKDPGCRNLRKYYYDVETLPDCQTETYDRLDAAVEVLPGRGCRKSNHYYYDVERPCNCEEETYDTHDFEVHEVKKPKKCSKVKLESYADHPLRECHCDCHNRRYVDELIKTSTFFPVSASNDLDDSDRNSIKRLKRSILSTSTNDKSTVDFTQCSTRPLLNHYPNPMKTNLFRKNPFLRRQPNGPRAKRKEHQSFMASHGGFVCHCAPSDQAGFTQDSEIVGAPKSSKLAPEPAVYVGDSSNPITYDQIKNHLDALPRENYSATTNEIIGNLTMLFYDIYQQKHKKNFTIPLKYGTRTVIDKGDGLQTYDIKPIEGEYKPPKLNRFASKGLNMIGRKIDRKTGQESTRPENIRRNRLRRIIP